MLMGFLGCLGAIYEIRCLLGLVSDSLCVCVCACGSFRHDELCRRVVSGGFTVEIQQFGLEEQ